MGGHRFLLRFQIHHGTAYFLGQLVKASLDKARITDLYPDLGGKGFPKTGGGNNDGGTYFPEILHRRFKGFRKVHGHAARQGDPHAPHLINDPSRRSYGYPVVSNAYGRGLQPLTRHFIEVLMTQHDHFG